jgi:hypothetical protein
MRYPNSFIPDGTELILSGGRTLHVPSVHLQFRQWTGKPISDDWGGKALIDYNGTAMFAELAIMNSAVDAGWKARWIETYSMKKGRPYHFTTWKGRPLMQDKADLITGTTQLNLLEKVASVNGTYYGCWDVLVWDNKRIIFIESKRNKADKIRDTQVKWLESGLSVGLRLDNFLIVQWDFFQPL